GVNAVEYSHALGNFPDVIVNALAIGADGTRWIGTQLDGLLRMHNGMVTSVDLGDDPLTGNRVYTVLVDQQNRVWAGTEHHDNSYSDRGLVMIDDTTWTVWSETQGDVPGSAHAIELDPFGNVFIAGQDGVYKYVADAWENYNASGGAAFMNTDMALAADGTAWVQNYYFTGLERCDGSSTVNVTTPIGGSHLHCVELDGQGNLWVGGQHALARMDPLGAWMVYDDQNALPLMGTINDIEFDTNGELWVAADDLLHFDGSTWTAIPHPVIGSGWMDDLEIEPSGVIWVALGPYGLGRYDGSWMYWDHTNSPIITDYVVEISLDPTRHRIWGATYGGGLFYMEDDDLVMGLPGRTASRASGQLELSPVPANDHVTVRTTGIDVGEKLIRVCSVSGAILRTSVFTGPSTTIDVSALATGVYEVSVQGKEGMQHGRLVVE
ncbi:MAG TPA: two-component regulator propeller domain-containing protein, partial [Flavobacteriales bacterium]|nr:two-component regulator propeller domain-containing protein [Flavobacteriales bacterium]